MLQDSQAHLSLAIQEREYYSTTVEHAKGVLQETFTINGELTVPPIHDCLSAKANDITMHFSFDMAQQVRFELYKI